MSELIDWSLTALACGLALWTASHALLHNRDPRATWGWILSCWLLPLLGPLLYFALGINRVQRRAKKLRPLHNPAQPLRSSDAYAFLPAHFQPLARIAEAVSGQALLAGNSVKLLFNGEQAYPAMLTAIEQAQQRVVLASYIFDRDAVGLQFVAALAAARQRGVEVRVLVDGTADVGPGERCIADALRTAEIPVQIFHPLSWVKRGFNLNLNLRNHRKLAVIDGHCAFTGGMNISRCNLLQDLACEWRESDVHFCLRGPIVTPLFDALWSDWCYAGGSPKAMPKIDAEREPGGSAYCRVIADGPNEDFGHLAMVLTAAISAARHRVQIMTPYFLPTRELIAALHAAALRGIVVEVFLPGVSDHRLIHYATRHLLREMLERGAKIYYQAEPFSHSKLFVMDDSYALIGSANLDPRSLRLNFELNVEVYDATLAGQLHQHFNEVRKTAKEVSSAQLRQLPLWQRLRDACCWLFSPYL